FHLRGAARDDLFVHLEIGDTVSQQATDLRELLEHVHVVADPGELLSTGHPRRPGADDRNLFPGLERWRFRLDPSLREGTIGDRAFDGFDGDGIILDIERAGGLAWCGTDAAGYFGKIIGGMEVARRFLPLAAIDEIVPVRDLIVDRATGVA